MTKILKCRDVGVDCDFVARRGRRSHGESQSTAGKDHGFAEIPPELAEKAKAAIHDEEAATA